MDTIRIDIRTIDEDIILAARSILRNKLVRDIAIIRLATPVSTGFLRSNWFWTTSRTSQGIMRGTYDSNATVPNTPWNPTPQSLRINNNTWYIVNNVSYGVGLNEGSDRGNSFAGASGAHRGFFERAISAFVLGQPIPE